MGKLVKGKLPCPFPGCNSSDAFHIFSDGVKCFSCEQSGPLTEEYKALAEDPNGVRAAAIAAVPRNKPQVFDYVEHRGLTRETLAKYGIKCGLDVNGNIVETRFPYTDDSGKTRTVDKQFLSYGSMKDADKPPLFGQNRFPRGSVEAITVTEGEYDAPSVYQMLGGYGCVSVRSSSTAKRDCQNNYDYLNSFEKIYFCFDNDEQGKKALEQVVGLFDPRKVYIVDLGTYKDANEFLTDGAHKEFKRVWYNAQHYTPEGIVSGLNEFKEIILAGAPKPGIPLPFPTLSEKLYGLHKGNILLFTALEGVGKTEILRAIEHHILRTTEDAIGVIHLEESKARTFQGFAGLERKCAVHLPDSGISAAETYDLVAKLVKQRDDRLHLYSHYDSDNPNVILDRIRFLVSGLGCSWVFLDHITACVTGVDDDKQRQHLDYISTKLGLMVEELNFGLIMVSHVDDHNRTRGSRLVSKVAGTRVHLERNHLAEQENLRNITQMIIYKNRFGAHTGPCSQLKFDIPTFSLSELNKAQELKYELFAQQFK